MPDSLDLVLFTYFSHCLIQLAAPVPAPTSPPGFISTPVVLELENVRGELSPEAEDAAVIATETFLEDTIANVTDIDCTSSGRRRRSLLRGLQEEFTTVTLVTTCQTEAVDGVSDADFSADVREAFAENGEQFTGTLASAAPFFDSVTVANVNTELVTPAPAPTVPPGTVGAPAPTGRDGGLSGGAITGIVIAVIVALALIGAGVYFAGKGGSGERAQSNPAPVVEELDTDMLNPPGTFESKAIVGTPVAAAASVAAAATGDPSVIKGDSTIAGEGGGEASTVGGESTAMSSLKPNMTSRQVEAPPGKLGIVIDTTLEGPVVHKISDTSPLKGSVFEGDIIVAINEVDTRAMSASAITALMGRTANMRRDLTILSADISN